MLLRFLFLALLLYLVWRGLRSLALDTSQRHRMPRDGASPGPFTEVSDQLVACNRCGVRIPAGRMVRQGGRVYCSQDCGAGSTGH
ncbi:MAG: PP0621 family protein [Acidobacteriota bacterium]